MTIIIKKKLFQLNFYLTSKFTKTPFLMLLRFHIIVCLLLVGATSYTQSNTIAAGGNSSGSAGTVSFTIGQIDYISQIGASGEINQGVQQPYEIVELNGIKTLNNNISLTIGPNPTSDKLILTADLSDNSELFYSLFDNNGKEIIREIRLMESNQIDISNHPIGMYQLQVRNSESALKSFKIIKN